MVHTKPSTPAGHGELLARPAFSRWASLLAENRAASVGWSFSVAGRPIADVRAQARAEALAAAVTFSEKLGVPVREPGATQGAIVLTGHQPELYHPGVWIKDFLLERLALSTGASSIDLVVDTDGFDTLAVSSPCMTPGVARCHQYLAVSDKDACYATSPVPTPRDLEDFCRAADQQLASLPSSAVRRHFGSFCDDMRAAAGTADNLAEFVTIARRRYESSAGTGYLELPLTSLTRTGSWHSFVADIVLNARRFAEAYNAELAEFRTVNKIRSSAQPFPDLTLSADAIELPLWRIADGRRSGVSARPLEDGGALLLGVDGETLVELPADGEAAAEAIAASGELVAPKALALTLFARVFVCDLMIHGVGGGRYDHVTDGVCRSYYDIEPPAFVVASITMYLPLGAHVVTEEEVAAAKERLNRLEHNPDALLGEVEFDSAEEQHRAAALAAEKAALVDAIAEPGADKKALGARIRLANGELAELLAPLKQGMAEELATLETQHAESEILTDRTYPFCFWAAQEVADKAW